MSILKFKLRLEVIHIKNTEIDYDDYDYGDNLDDKYEDPFTLDERYLDDELYCPECHVRKVKYKERGECRGATYTIDIWECPVCGN